MEFSIEDRASRLSHRRRGKLLTGETSTDEVEEEQTPSLGFIRNRATVSIEVVPLELGRSGVRVGKLVVTHFPLYPYYSSQSTPQKMATIEVADIDIPAASSPSLTLDDLTLELEAIEATNLPKQLNSYIIRIGSALHEDGRWIRFYVARRTAKAFDLLVEATNGNETAAVPLYLLPSLKFLFSLSEVDLSSGHYHHHRLRLHEERVTLKPIFKERRVWFPEGEIVEKLHVNESTVIGYVIRKFSALTSYPSEDAERIRYRLSHDSTAKQHFPLELTEQDGLLCLKHRLPKAPAAYSVSISAYLQDKTIPSGSAVLNITVVVADSNNHCPEFDPGTLPNNFEIRLSSRNFTGTVFTPRVSDKDTGENGRVLFKLVGVDGNYEKYFGVDENSGEVSLGCT